MSKNELPERNYASRLFTVLRKRRTKTICRGAILTNLTNSRSIFWLQFLGGIFTCRDFRTRMAADSQKGRKIICFFGLQVIPCALTPLPATFAKHIKETLTEMEMMDLFAV